MNRWTQVTLAIGLAFFLGCTPPGDDIVKKSSNSPNFEGISTQADSASDIDADPVDFLDPGAKAIVHSYGSTIREYSSRYGFDWRLILAVMKQESSFRPNVESPKGASGLMQIMPVTGEEVARVLDVEDMSHPRNNIRGGIFYLRQLYGLFNSADEADRIKLALAAYNAGISRIYDAQELASFLHEDPSKWQSVKDALPYLSKRYNTLHRDVWQQDKPKSGWFGNARETLAYVEGVMNYYDEYRLLLN